MLYLKLPSGSISIEPDQIVYFYKDEKGISLMHRNGELMPLAENLPELQKKAPEIPIHYKTGCNPNSVPKPTHPWRGRETRRDNL